jgi:hypothetical protein
VTQVQITCIGARLAATLVKRKAFVLALRLLASEKLIRLVINYLSALFAIGYEERKEQAEVKEGVSKIIVSCLKVH